MMLSRYIRTVRAPSFPGHTLIFSTRKTSLALLADDDFNRLQENESLPAYQDDLKSLGILVEDHKQEREEISSFYKELNHLDNNLTVAVVLGMQCNFDCGYCYEGTLKGKKAMDDETADRLIAFIKERFSGTKDRIHLDFYGGEPLLYVERIKYLATRLKKFAAKKGAAFDFNIVTNGSLLTPKVVKQLKACGLSYAKVTIDGLPLNHNHSRPFKNGKPSFDTIVENLEEVCDEIEIGLGGNFTSFNYEQFPLLLDKLKISGIGPKKLERVLFNMVMKVTDEFASPKCNGGCASVNEPWLPEASLFIRKEVMKRGYFVPKIRPEVCAVMVSDNFTVNYDGSIYKCLPLAGREQFKIGDIWEGIKEFKDSHHLDNWQKEEKCQECAYLPLCFGGCRHMQYQRTGSMAGVDCQKDYFDKTLGEMILQDVQYRNGTEKNIW